MPNPYTISPVTSPRYFNAKLGDHGKLATRLLENMKRTEPPPDSISILGERRFGKTSLLGYLENEVKDTPGLVVATIDMLSLSPQSPEGFYQMLTMSLFDVGQLPSDDPPLDYRGFRGFLTKLKSKGERLILLIDEFDIVARQPEFQLEFFERLRSLNMTHPLRMIVASVAPLNKIAHSSVYGSPFFNIFLKESLMPFSRKEAEALVKDPPGGAIFSDADADAIINLSGTHPYFLQMCCNLAYDMRDANGALDLDDLRKAFAKRAQPQFQYIWEHSSPPEKRTLFALATGNSSDNQGLGALSSRGYVVDGSPPRLFSEGFADFVKRQLIVEEPMQLNENGSQGNGVNENKSAALQAEATKLTNMRVDPKADLLRVALTVGVNNYKYEESGVYRLNSLSFAERDVTDMEKILTDSGFNVTSLIGTNATFEAVKNAFKQFAALAGSFPHPESCFVFHFSGHGQMDPDNKDKGYLMLYDTDPSNPTQNSLEMEYLVYKLMASVKVPNSLLLLDCCHAGFAAGVRNVVPVRDRLHNLTQQLFADVRGRLVLGACAGDALARELMDLSHGVFTHHVLRHWRDRDGNNLVDPITQLSLANYVSVTMPRDYPTLPKPIWGGSGAGSFILRRG